MKSAAIARGTAVIDYDNDGDDDLIIVRNHGPAQEAAAPASPAPKPQTPPVIDSACLSWTGWRYFARINRRPASCAGDSRFPSCRTFQRLTRTGRPSFMPCLAGCGPSPTIPTGTGCSATSTPPSMTSIKRPHSGLLTSRATVFTDWCTARWTNPQDRDFHLATALYARGLALIQVEIQLAALPPESQPASRPDILGQAVADLNVCVAQHPVHLDYLVALATAEGMRGNYERAEQLLATALRVAPKDENTNRLMNKARARASFYP